MDFRRMSVAQLDAYALEKGIDLSLAKTKESKFKAIRDAGESDRIVVCAMGITVEVDAAAFDDFDMIDDLAALQDGDIFVLPRLVKGLLGDDYPRVRDHLSGEDGKLTATKAAQFFSAVIEAAGAKN